MANKQCPHCRTWQPHDSIYCANCACQMSVKNVAPVTPKAQSKSRKQLFVLLLFLVPIGLAFFIELLGVMVLMTRQKPQKQPDIVQSMPRPSASQPPLPSPSVTQPKTLVSVQPPANAKTARIISENANLRESADQNEVSIETISENTEVVRQKGPWFLVKTATGSGWLHGNTIRLKGPSQPETSTPALTYSEPKQGNTPHL